MNELYKEIKNIVENRIGKTITGTDKMIDWGIDSMDFVEIIIEIENHYNIEFPIDNLSMEKISNFDDFVSLFRKEI